MSGWIIPLKRNDATHRGSGGATGGLGSASLCEGVSAGRAYSSAIFHPPSGTLPPIVTGVGNFASPAGAYTWNLRAWGPGGTGPWNAGLTFTYTTGLGGFNSQFNNDATGWGYYGSTPWYIGSTYVYAPGMSGYWASLAHDNTFTNFDYKARLWRAGNNEISKIIVPREKSRRKSKCVESWVTLDRKTLRK